MEAYVGLDVHSKRSVFVIEAEDGRVVARGDIPTTPEGFRRLRRQHELTAETPVALETGTVAFYAARELARVGLRPIVIDAHEVRVKAHRPQQKGDRRDAFELCEGLRREQYRSVVDTVRMLAPAGRVVVFEHNPLNPVTRWVVRHTPIDRNAQLVRAGEVKQRLGRLGLERLRARFLLFFPPRIALERTRFLWTSVWSNEAGRSDGIGYEAA